MHFSQEGKKYFILLSPPLNVVSLGLQFARRFLHNSIDNIEMGGGEGLKNRSVVLKLVDTWPSVSTVMSKL